MADFRTDWDDAWTTHADGETVADGAGTDVAVISNDGKWGTEVSIQADYGNPATEGIKVYVLRLVSSGVYEQTAPDDKPWGFEMPYAASITQYRTFFIDGVSVSGCQIHVTNDSGASVDVTVKTRQLDAIVSS